MALIYILLFVLLVEVFVTLAIKLQLYWIIRKYQLVSDLRIHFYNGFFVTIYGYNKLQFSLKYNKYKLDQTIEAEQYLMLNNLKIEDLETEFSKLIHDCKNIYFKRTLFRKNLDFHFSKQKGLSITGDNSPYLIG